MVHIVLVLDTLPDEFLISQYAPVVCVHVFVCVRVCVCLGMCRQPGTCVSVCVYVWALELCYIKFFLCPMSWEFMSRYKLTYYQE